LKKSIQFRIFKGEKYYVADCLDMPVVTQALTLDELVMNIKEALELHLEEDSLDNYEIIANPDILASIDLGEFVYA
jgi:predicted RNase H-like HicB family nuclease